MRPIRSISVLMPTWQGMEFLERVLEGLARQRCEPPWDFLAIDSGSTDGTWEVLGEWEERLGVPLRRERIDPVEFDHGDTRNLLAARSRGDLCVFLTQDAIPVGEYFLAHLARNFEDEAVGAAYCRNLPRPDAQLLTRIFSEKDPGYSARRREVRLPEAAEYAALDAHAKRVLYNFNDVASAVRRELWERHPFPRTNFGEDVLLARALLEAGYTIVYDDEAVVEHSHDYEPDECYARGRIDGEFNARWLDRISVVSEKNALTLARRQLERDQEALAGAGLAGAVLERELARARKLREASFLGLWAGGRTEERSPATRVRDETRVKVLYVVHGFPPDTWAGTEIYTYNIAKELQARGHDCTVLTRVPATEDGPEDFSIEESEFQGLRVLRLTHRLEHGSLRESYVQPKAEAAFARLLRRERPDLVHFQHLIHTSAGLVRIAKDLGLATVITCHDYWAICPRVQLIRPDGVICPDHMGAGCYLCVKEEGLKAVGLARALGEAGRKLLPDFARARATSEDVSEGSRRRWAELSDLLDRREVVTEAYGAADLRISPSRFLRQTLVDSAGYDPRRFLFSDNGMRTDHVEALDKQRDPAGRVRFGFVGSLVWYKGGETMIRAMHALRGTKAVLNVYGSFDPGSDEHHAELRELAQGCEVHFKGRFDNARLSEVYAEIDVLIVPSVWYENSPITIHEAYLTRTPVLASNIGGMAEFVRDGVDGLTFAVGDPRDLAHKMRRFLDEPGLLDDLSRDFMPIKTIAENAEETEFRYRALCCIERPPAGGGGVLIDCAATATKGRFGVVEPQGVDMLLLRPGGTAVEYDVRDAGGGRREFLVSVLALGAEPEVELGGRLLVNGVEIGTLPLSSSEGEDRLVEHSLQAVLPENAHTLRIECAVAEGGPEAHLRLARLRVRESREEEEA